jgi:hypothetical protein
VLYLVLICKFCHKVIDEVAGSYTSTLFSYNQSEWIKNKNFLHKFLTTQQLTISSSLQIGLHTPSNLLINELLRCELVLSILFKK